MQHDKDTESAASALAEAALRDAEMGSPAPARQFLAQALKLNHTENVIVLAALVDARSGDLRSAQGLAEQLQQQFPQATFIQHYWLPVIRAEIDLQQKRAGKAIDDLVPSLGIELSTPASLTVTTLYPAYIRGQAYLALGDGAKAAVEFQKIIDHPGVSLNSPLSALAFVEVARAYTLAGDPAKARQAYQKFLQLWKTSDPGIPIFQEVKAEYSKLRPAVRP